jgi:RNA polymerase sigma-70 factor (ECF subfamily)
MDRELVLRAQGGSREAFGVLLGGSIDHCYAVAYRVLRDSELARDAVQGALLEAWKDLGKLRDPERFEAWLTRLVINACYSEARRERRWTAKLGLLPAGRPADPDIAESFANRDELERAFRRLPVDERAVVVLHHYAGLSLEEIAATLEIPAGTARSRLHYALRQLRAAIEADARSASLPVGGSG